MPTTNNVAGPRLTFESAQIAFRNFSGKETPFNRKGDRNFCVILSDEDMQQVDPNYWNVKYLKPREEGDEPKPYLKVKVKYKEGQRPPRVVLISSRGKNDLTEEDINMLDWAEIKNVDLIVNPYEYDFADKTGVAAYLRAIYVTIVDDPLEMKYMDIPDSATSALMGNEPEWGDD